MSLKRNLIGSGVLLLASLALADVNLPSIINSNMVLQQRTKVPIWGWAQPGEKIYVKGSWQRLGTSTKADKNGEWIVKIKTPKAGGPYTLTIKGKEFKDLMLTLKHNLKAEENLMEAEKLYKKEMVKWLKKCKGTEAVRFAWSDTAA